MDVLRQNREQACTDPRQAQLAYASWQLVGPALVQRALE